MSRLVVFFFLLLGSSLIQAKAREIVLWHSLAGHLGAEMTQLAAGFNRSQSDYQVNVVYKGEYSETLTSFAAAFRAKQPPALVQIFEVGTATMLHPPGIIKPVDELMREQGFSLPTAEFLPALRAFYSESGRLLAMPFNVSIPVIYFNTEALAQVGYDQTSFPKTWDELEILAAKLRKQGFACAYTSAYPGWIQIESFAAIHNVALLTADQSQAIYNNPAIISHLERLKKWQQLHYFEYGGRASDATILFTSGRCPLFSQSSGSYTSLATLVPFHLGVAMLPVDSKITKQRYNNVVGGAALWAVAGQSPEIYRGIAYFFAYIARPDIQQQWHLQTGYLPIGLKGRYAFADDSHPVLTLAQLDLGKETVTTEGLHVGPQEQIRAINDEALESIFAGMSTVDEAWAEAVQRTNYALTRFLRNTNEGS